MIHNDRKTVKEIQERNEELYYYKEVERIIDGVKHTVKLYLDKKKPIPSPNYIFPSSTQLVSQGRVRKVGDLFNGR